MQGLERFIEAHEQHYLLALTEVRAGKKQSHWIWYIFPQMYGLGRSYYAQLYGIHDREEAVHIPEQCRPVIPAQKGENDARSPIKNR